MPCVNHPEVAEIATCSRCSKPLCANCCVSFQERMLCGACKDISVRAVERGDVVDSTGRKPSAWETRASLGSLLATVKQVLLSPGDFFSTLPLRGKGEFKFLIAVGWPSVAIGTVLGVLVQGAWIGRTGARLEATGPIWIGIGVGVLFAPLSLAIGSAIGGAFSHLFLKIVGGARAKMETTVRTVCFVNGATSLFQVIPVAGGVIGGLWGMVVNIIALKNMHGTSYARVIAAVMIPLGCLLYIGIMAALGMSVFSR